MSASIRPSVEAAIPSGNSGIADNSSIAAPASAVQRRAALERAQAEAPFLARLSVLHSEDTQRFIAHGADVALRAIAPPPSDENLTRALRLWRGRIALILALADLSGEHDIETTTRHLSDFADTACDLALVRAMAEKLPGRYVKTESSGRKIRGIAVIALGKLGSHELNYSSDIDPILIFDPHKLIIRRRDDPSEMAVRIARRMIEILSARTAEGHVLRVDLRLRPRPEVTPIILSLDAAISYYESAALPWEQAAFIRSRPSAGDKELGRHFLDSIESFIWRKSLDFQQLHEIGIMSNRIRDHYANGQVFRPGFDLKRGRGGIREIEFFTQVHQLIFGGREPALRVAATVDALAALASAGRIEAQQARKLAEHYRLLRRIEHRLQMIEDQQTHSLPEKQEMLDTVARLDGLPGGEALLGLLGPAVAEVSANYDKLVRSHRTAGGWPHDEQQLAATLTSAGFNPPHQALARILDWRSGRLHVLRSVKALDALEVVLPALMTALGEASNPEMALSRFDRMISSLPSTINFFHLLAAEPQLARVMTRVLSLTPTLADALGTKAELIEGLIDARAFEAPETVEGLLRLWRPTVQGRDYETLLDIIRDRVGEMQFAYGVQLIEGQLIEGQLIEGQLSEGIRDPLLIGRGYAALAEAALTIIADASIAVFEKAHGRVPESELVILALGRLGGEILTHASDLDIIYLFTGDYQAKSDGPRPLTATRYYNRLAQRLTAALSVPTAAGTLYKIDTRLRPSGAQGLLAIAIDSFAQYQRQNAWTWERMALLRARTVYGSQQARAAMAKILTELHSRPHDKTTLIGDAVEMRERIAAHKPPSGPFDVKNGAGGLVDLEFALHVTQITSGTGLTPQIGAALQNLVEEKLTPPAIVAAQALLTRMLVALRLMAPDGAPLNDAGKLAIARACGIADWNHLVVAHDSARCAIGSWWQAIREQRLTRANQSD